MLSILIPNHRESGIHDFVSEIERLGIAGEIIVVHDRHSQGKGWALREALSGAIGDEIAFIDGDGEIPARMLKRLIPFLEDFDVVVGSKRITRSTPRRKIMTHLTRIWFRLLYGLYVDSQTGIKLFRRDALKSINDCWESNGFIFDVEILAKLQSSGFKMVEVPIECEIRRQLKIKTIFQIFMESLWLKYRLSFR